MSIDAVKRVWAYSQHKGGALTLMLAIGDHTNDQGLAWPGVTRLARMTRLTERQVHKLLGKIDHSGEVVIERGGGRRRSNRYRIMLPADGRRNRVVLAPQRSGAKSKRSREASRGRRWQTGWFTEESAYKP